MFLYGDIAVAAAAVSAAAAAVDVAVVAASWRVAVVEAGRGGVREGEAERERDEENSKRVSSNGKHACASRISKGKSCLVRSDARIRVQVKLRGSRLVGLTSRSAQGGGCLLVEELYVTSIGDS